MIMTNKEVWEDLLDMLLENKCMDKNQRQIWRERFKYL